MIKSLTKADIVESIYSRPDSYLSRGEVKNIVEDMLALMKNAISEDGSLLISGFGKFDAYGKDARKGRNPHTAETITLPPRRVVVFRLSRRFRDALNEGFAA